MIVLGADTHKRSHTIAAVCAATGEVLGEKTVGSVPAGSPAWWSGRVACRASGCGRFQDCRHVSGSFERFFSGARRAHRARPDQADGRGAQGWPPAREVRGHRLEDEDLDRVIGESDVPQCWRLFGGGSWPHRHYLPRARAVES